MKDFIKSKDAETLIVFKGIKEAYADIKFEDILGNSFDYFNKNLTKDFFVYEEFLLCQNFLQYKFKKVLIVENNIYNRYYPLNVNIEDGIINELIKNKDDEEFEDENFKLDVNCYFDYFSSVEKINGKPYVIYNDYADFLEENIEIEYKPYYSDKNTVEQKLAMEDVRFIKDEKDYLSSLDDDKEYFLNQDFSKTLLDRIEIYNNNIRNKFFFKESKEESKNENFKIEKILNHYWGYDSFRNLKVYNREKLDIKEKEVFEILQSDIINKIIQESENAYQSYGRDIFVTAPTGAGKSVIFQIPAIYLDENYDKLTIIVSPLIGLMKDQVSTLENKGYRKSRTLNSEITISEKEKIMEEIRDGQCKILYLSPETLINNGLLSEIIKTEQKIGLVVIDEAHIVTTWGKQFRADYWYLGDHIQKIRKLYQKNYGTSFIIAAFTATAIYGGVENMYEEIKTSLYLNNPHTYLGYVRRENIEFKIKEVPKRTSRMEYKVVKFDSLVEKIKQNILLNNKILIYFPTVSLIEEFYDYLIGKNLANRVVKYYGSLEKSDKDDSLEQFKVGNKKVMLATKAFGMGIDIEDIFVISHFAPTGNLCDYLQEVGRAARDKNINGQAIYDHMSNDFKYINRFHGLSTIKIYQLVEVIKKIYELHSYSWEKKETRKRNEMLIDTSTFSYIFDTNDFFDQDTILNKVKTALLLIQKDFENLKGWAPFTMRPMPLFAYGYFKIDQNNVKVLTKDYGNILENIKSDIYKVDLKRIWEKSFDKEMSFPKFKYFLYTQQESEIKKVALTSMTPYLKISLSKNQKSKFKVDQILETIEKMLGPSILASKQLSRDELNSLFQSNFKVTSFKAKILTDIFLSTIDYYKEKVNNALNKKIYKNRLLVNGENKYEFLPGIESYYKWIKRKNEYMEGQIKEDSNLYIEIKESEEILSFLGFCEAFSILTFKSLGGEGGQLYIYVNERKSLSKIAKSPNLYKNKLLQNIDERHKINVDLLSHIYTSNFTSEEIWDIIENYFIGNEPENFRGKK